MNKIFILVITAFLLGCGSSVKIINLTDTNLQVLENPYVVLDTPTPRLNWRLYNDTEWRLAHQGTKSENPLSQSLYLSHKDPQIGGFNVRTANVDGKIYGKLEYKNLKGFPDQFVEDGKKIIDGFGEKNISYYLVSKVYVDGIRCDFSRRLQGFGGSYAPFGSFDTYIMCDYALIGQPNNQYRDFSFRYSISTTAKDTPEAAAQRRQLADETALRMINSVHLKNVDIERMKALGLYDASQKFSLDPQEAVIWEEGVGVSIRDKGVDRLYVPYETIIKERQARKDAAIEVWDRKEKARKEAVMKDLGEQ
ncbi:hypothetical protein [Vibrio aphrogenes]|uniref:hypothetical protein n=1 Tax=Vibrio aphrogenes TaxID=1891186 RepID=UPI000B363237|nr:hypothetical protein [Vibrio aphrogenes]